LEAIIAGPAKELGSVLSPYAGMMSFVSYVDGKSGYFADDIVKSLQRAHLSTVGPGWVGIRTISGPLPTGVIVASTQDKASENAARVLCREFFAES
jgi:hypothetical protein